MNRHLRPTAEIAHDVLLPGDPGRALALAQELLAEPRMSNHHRGLWGYGGVTAAGRPLTIQASGVGGPSVAAVAADLAAAGARRIVRIGTARAVAGRARLGDAIVASAALSADGTSRALGANGRAEPDQTLAAALAAAAPFARAELVTSTDLAYEDAAGPAAGEAVAQDLGTAALYALGAREGLATAAVLVVAGAGGTSLADDALEQISVRVAGAACDALAGAQPPLEPGVKGS